METAMSITDENSSAAEIAGAICWLGHPDGMEMIQAIF